MNQCSFHQVRGAAFGMALAMLVGCGGERQEAQQTPAGAPGPAEAGAPQVQLCDFADGPEDAKVKIVAFYPGRHEDTLAAVKSLRTEFKDDVRVEIVDWRTPEGIRRRDKDGLTCAGILINGKNAFDIEIDGKKSKVLFVRGIDGEWTKEDLFAAVRQELAR